MRSALPRYALRHSENISKAHKKNRPESASGPRGGFEHSPIVNDHGQAAKKPSAPASFQTYIRVACRAGNSGTLDSRLAKGVWEAGSA